MTSERIDALKEKISLLPSEPGVYRFLNSEGTVIYVGKAKDLKKRVSSYFNRNRLEGDRKLRVLVRQIHDIRHIVVLNEADAFLLENNLIKDLKPRYNVMLKDDKTYPWICIKNEPFPRIFSTRKLVRDGSRYFGPYASVFIQKQMLELIREIRMFRTCSLNLAPEKIAQGKYTVCLEYHIGNCKGPCVGYQTEEEYARNVDFVANILKGNTRQVIDYLQAEMRKSAEALRYEEAQELKDRIELVRNFQSKTVIVNTSLTNLDVFYIILDEGIAFCNFMRVRNGAVVNSFTVELKPGLEDRPEDILTYAIFRIREQLEGTLSREIIVPFLPNAQLFPESVFHVPQKGDKLKLLELAEKNAKIFKIEKLKYIEKVDPQRHVDRIMEQMRKDLYMASQPRHIECFDNSNIQGTHPVASCVVFRDGKPSRKEYRHFNIKTVVGANDFASMEEVVTRRYTRMMEEGKELPQLIVIDGGKGQLGFAYRVLTRLGLQDKIRMIGLAKRMEEVFFPNDPTPHYLDKTSETLKILMHIRDEAHRFGIAFHRQKRSIDFIRSELESIPGLGSKSIEKLLKKFKTISRIRKAEPAELEGVVGKSRAAAILDFYKEKK